MARVLRGLTLPEYPDVAVAALIDGRAAERKASVAGERLRGGAADLTQGREGASASGETGAAGDGCEARVTGGLKLETRSSIGAWLT